MALINCPDCAANVSSDAMTCQGCGCILRVRVRGFWGKLFKRAFIGWNVLMLIWLVVGTVITASTPVHNDNEATGVALVTAIGAGIVMYLWFGGAFWFGILVLLSRPNSSSPSIRAPHLEKRAQPMPVARVIPKPAPNVEAEVARYLEIFDTTEASPTKTPTLPAPVIKPTHPASSNRRLIVVLAGMVGLLVGSFVVLAVLSFHSHSQANPIAPATASLVRPITSTPPVVAAPAPAHTAHAKQHRPSRVSPAAQPPPTPVAPTAAMTGNVEQVARTESTGLTDSHPELADPYADDAKLKSSTAKVDTGAPTAKAPLPSECREYQVAIDKLANDCKNDEAKVRLTSLRNGYHGVFDNWDSKRESQKVGAADTCATLMLQLHSQSFEKLTVACNAE